MLRVAVRWAALLLVAVLLAMSRALVACGQCFVNSSTRCNGWAWALLQWSKPGKLP